MKTRRGLMAGFLVAALFAAATAAVVAFWRPGLPPPAESSRRQVLYWLVTRDLSLETAETRAALVRRVETETLDGLKWSDLGDGVTPPYRAMLRKNVPLLVEPWFRAKADRYFSLQAQERSVYLDEVLDMIEIWRGIDVLAMPATSAEGQGGAGFLSILVEQVSRCVEQTTDSVQRQQLAEFALALQTRWLTRSLWAK